MAWLLLWCQGGPVRRGALSPAQHSRVCRHEPAGLWVLVAVRRKEMLVSVEASLPSLDVVSFLGCGEHVPRTILAGYMCRNRPSVPGV